MARRRVEGLPGRRGRQDHPGRGLGRGRRQAGQRQLADLRQRRHHRRLPDLPPHRAVLPDVQRSVHRGALRREFRRSRHLRLQAYRQRLHELPRPRPVARGLFPLLHPRPARRRHPQQGRRAPQADAQHAGHALRHRLRRTAPVGPFRRLLDQRHHPELPLPGGRTDGPIPAASPSRRTPSGAPARTTPRPATPRPRRTAAG